jgi:hypothetical protein
MNQKVFTKTITITLVTFLIGTAGYFMMNKDVLRQAAPAQNEVPSIEQTNPQTYKDEQYGVEITYPITWYAYGNRDAFANPDLLSWRGFVPDYDSNKSDEEQKLVSISVFNKNPDSSFDMPRQFIEKINSDEKWESVTVNGYLGTKIANAKSNTVTDYVFEHTGRLYILSASQQSLFEKVLPTLRFF